MSRSREIMWRQFTADRGPMPADLAGQAVWQTEWAAYQAEHQNDVFTDPVTGKKFVEATPTWIQILPIWLMIARDAYQMDNAANIANFEREMARMAEAADKWGDHARKTIPVEAGDVEA